MRTGVRLFVVCGMLAAVRGSAADLPNGVAASEVTPTSAVIWTRTTAPGLVTFELSDDPTFATNVASQQVAADPDLLIPQVATFSSLAPNTTYYYRATDAAADTRSGRFVTPATNGYHGFRLGVSGDWRGELAPYPAVRNAAAADLDLWVALGDTIYADFPSPAAPLPQAQSLTDYRLKHAEPLTERFGLNTLGDLRSATAQLANIDDHEVINDFAGGAPPSSDPRFAGETVAFINETQLFVNGLTAFQEYHAYTGGPWTGTGEPRFDGKPKLYRAVRYGADAAVFVVDARSFRDEGLPPVVNPTDPFEIFNFVVATYTPGRTMLGVAQREALMVDLLAAEAAGVTWKFLLIPEPVQNLGFLAASDRFEGYAAERTELLAFIADNEIRNVVFVAADIHGTLVNDVKYQFDPFDMPRPTGAFEITTGSVAFAAPFGPTVVTLGAQAGLITPAEFALYEGLPRTGKDEFLADLINEQLSILSYPQIGLDATDDIDETLLQGTYFPTHSYGWTEFDVDAATQALTVTTWGIDWYTEAELLADPAAIIARQPEIVSQFVVRPRLALGDMNCDGALTLSDIAGFVLALTDAAGYAASFPDCRILNADLSGDGNLTVSDIAFFVEALTN